MASNHVKVKIEKGTRLSSKSVEEKELCSYLPDRIEVIKQAFSSLRNRELFAIIPPALRSIPLSTLKEMCLDEILGISTKRLRSIIDDAECPSNTESSSDESEKGKNILDDLETISLDSISSEEDDILAHGKTKSKRRHKRNKELQKQSKRVKSKDKPTTSTNDETVQKESGMTVLELLELQARARAIRAQLAAVAGGNIGISDSEVSDSGDEVLIKEENPVIVEIPSSDDENKEVKNKNAETQPIQQLLESADSQTQSNADNPAKKSRKIKLNRKPATASVNVTNDAVNKSLENEPTKASTSKINDTEKPSTSKENVAVNASTSNNSNEKNITTKRVNNGEKKKPKPKKYRKSTVVEEDEITLDVSDSEKMDLFEISNSSDEESDSDDESKEDEKQIVESVTQEDESNNKENEPKSHEKTSDVNTENQIEENSTVAEENNSEITKEIDSSKEQESVNNSDTLVETISPNLEEKNNTEDENVPNIETDQLEDKDKAESENVLNVETNKPEDIITSVEQENKEEERELSEGECSNYSSDNVEITEIKPDIVCISDDDKPEVVEPVRKQKKKKKKKEKEKEKEKDKEKQKQIITPAVEQIANIVMEISDDSSCEDNSNENSNDYLSKEPTAEEIEELSKKIDCEIEREDIVMGKNVCGDVDIENDNDSQDTQEESAEPEGPLGTWKERWLKSSKVKKVIATSNLFNAMRKKNKELKKKLAENAKLVEEEAQKAALEETQKAAETPVEAPAETPEPETPKVDEGSIEHYNMLTGSTKYVNPVGSETQEPNPNLDSMAKDAQELMKMYKKLLKMNKRKNETDEERKERKEKKKKKKDKKKKKGDKSPQEKSQELNETGEQISGNPTPEQTSEVPEQTSEIASVPDEDPKPDEENNKSVADTNESV